MKSIAYFINTYLRPSEGFIYDQIANIKGYSVEVMTRTCYNRDSFPFDKINCIEQNSGNIFEGLAFTLFRRSKYLEKVMKEKNISLIHAHFGVDAVYALPLAEKFNVPLITTFHGYDITRLPKFTLNPPAWFNYWANFEALKRKGALFLGVSDFISKKLVEKGFPEDKVRTHYLGIDNDVRTVKPYYDKILLTAGRLVEKKGIEYLIRACAKLVDAFPDIKLIICGDGPLKSKLQELTVQLGINDHVVFTGWQSKSEVEALMKKARVFVLPSVTAADGDAEGLGMVFLEAMALGIPCVGTRSGGIPDAVSDNKTGFLVNEKDPAGLADKIKLLLSDYSLCEKLGANGRQVALDKFNIKKQIVKLENIYNDLI